MSGRIAQTPNAEADSESEGVFKQMRILMPPVTGKSSIGFDTVGRELVAPTERLGRSSEPAGDSAVCFSGYSAALRAVSDLLASFIDCDDGLGEIFDVPPLLRRNPRLKVRAIIVDIAQGLETVRGGGWKYVTSTWKDEEWTRKHFACNKE